MKKFPSQNLKAEAFFVVAEPAQVCGHLDAHEAGGGEPVKGVRLHPVNFSALTNMPSEPKKTIAVVKPPSTINS